MSDVIETMPSPDERRLQKVEEVRSLFAEIRESEMERMRGEFAAIMAEAAKPPVAKPAETKVEKALEAETVGERGDFGYGDIKTPLDLRYETLPKHMRKVRSPQGDSEIGRWFRAMLRGDRATLIEVDKSTRVYLERQYGL